MEKSKIYLDFQCQKEWNAMTPIQCGRFCNDCKKTVADFSKIPLNVLNGKFTTNTDKEVCGSFFAYQLDKPFNNWKDTIIALYQKIKLDTTSYKLSRAVLLFILKTLFRMTGCKRRVGGRLSTRH